MLINSSYHHPLQPLQSFMAGNTIMMIYDNNYRGEIHDYNQEWDDNRSQIMVMFEIHGE